MSNPQRESAGQPTMRDVALRARVSPMTVSRALRDPSSVSEETKARVLDAVAALGYRRNEVARSLRLGRSHGLIGLIVTNLANPFYSQLALGVESYAAELGKRVILGNSAEDLRLERQLVQDFAERRLDGLIVVPASNDHAHLSGDELGGIPAVLAASSPSNVELDAVLLDDFGGTAEAITRLITHGHERIAFLGLPPWTWTGSERFRGYCSALATAGITLDDRYIHRQAPSARTAERITRELLTLDRPPTAVFAANNRNTIGSYRALLESPRPVELCGFDNFDFADLLAMPLSVVSYDPHELGWQAARLLWDRLQAPNASQAPRRLVIPTEIIDYAPLRQPSADQPRRTRRRAGPGNST